MIASIRSFGDISWNISRDELLYLTLKHGGFTTTNGTDFDVIWFPREGWSIVGPSYDAHFGTLEEVSRRLFEEFMMPEAEELLERTEVLLDAFPDTKEYLIAKGRYGLMVEFDLNPVIDDADFYQRTKDAL